MLGYWPSSYATLVFCGVCHNPTTLTGILIACMSSVFQPLYEVAMPTLFITVPIFRTHHFRHVDSIFFTHIGLLWHVFINVYVVHDVMAIRLVLVKCVVLILINFIVTIICMCCVKLSQFAVHALFYGCSSALIFCSFLILIKTLIGKTPVTIFTIYVAISVKSN